MNTSVPALDHVEEMRSRLCQAFHRQTSSIITMSTPFSKRRKLVLHFDINKTIVAVDSATGETVEESLNVFLSGMAWGKENAGKWECAMNELSTHPRDRGNVSFYKYEERKFETRDRGKFRYQLSSFTDLPQGSYFKPYLNGLLQKLSWRLPYDKHVHGNMTVPGTKEVRYHFIVPSFFKLLSHLNSERRNFAIVLRTFGSDAQSVLGCIRDAIKHKMPFCEDIQPMLEDIAGNALVLRRNSDHNFVLLSDAKNQRNEDGCFSSTPAKTDDEMYNFMTSCTGVTAIRDDVDTWWANKFHPTKGKPLWLNMDDTDSHHILFDDNIRPGNPDSIVNLRLKRRHTETYEDVPSHREVDYVNKYIVPVTFPEAIMNDDYFIQKLQLCESAL